MSRFWQIVGALAAAVGLGWLLTSRASRKTTLRVAKERAQARLKLDRDLQETNAPEADPAEVWNKRHGR